MNDEVHHRHSIRLPEYDYSLPGAYFITICTHGQKSLFGEIVDGVMQLNDFGSIVEIEWMKTPQIRHEIELGDFVIMSNHFHAIVTIKEHFVGAYGHTPLPSQETRLSSQTCHTPLPEKFASPSRTIGALIRGFKGSVTKSINLFRHTPGQPVWQRNYYEHIIRDEPDMQMISEYILTNPASWVNNKFSEKTNV